MRKFGMLSFFIFVFFAFSLRTNAYTLDSEGRAKIYTLSDLLDALKVFNGRSTAYPTVTSNPPTFIFQNDIYMNKSMDSQDYRLKGGSASSPTQLVIDGNGYKYTYGVNQTDMITFLPNGNYIQLTFQNMNIGNVITPTPVGTPNMSDVNYPSTSSEQNKRGVTDNYWGMFYCSGRTGIGVTMKNVNYVAAAYGQMLYCTGSSQVANTLTFEGNNNIIYPPGATNNAQELAEGITQVFVKNGTTNVSIKNGNVGHAVFSELGNTGANNPLKLVVEKDAILNFAGNGTGWEFYHGINTSASCIWDVWGEVNFDFNGCTRPFFGDRPASFTLNVYENAKFTTKGGLNWNIFQINNGKAVINAEYNSYIDWSRNNGRIFTGTPNATNSQINLNSPRFVAFRSNTNNSVFGSSYNNLKINFKENMAGYAYSSTNPDNSTDGNGDSSGSTTIGVEGLIVENDLSSMVRAVDHPTQMGASFTNANDLFPVKDANGKDVLSKFKDAKAIFFKKAGIWFAEKPGDMSWNYSLKDVFLNAKTVNGDFLAPRNSTVDSNDMIFTVRDDNPVTQTSWYLSADASPLQEVNTGEGLPPLVVKENDGTEVDIQNWSLSNTSPLFKEGKYNTDKTITYDASHGVLAKLNAKMKRGSYQGVCRWTLVDSIR